MFFSLVSVSVLLLLNGAVSATVTRGASLCWRGLLAVVLGLMLMPGAARAEEPIDPEPLGPEPAAAELFLQGRELIKQGHWEAGCAKLELSMKRYAAPSTLMNIARCREHEGKLATAWALYRRALVLNLETDGDRRKQELDEVGQAAIDALEPRLPRLLVTVKPAPPGLRVSEGGRELPVATAVPLDAGSYEVVATAPGYAATQQHVVLSEAKTTELELTLIVEATADVPIPLVPQPEEVPPAAGTPLWVWVVGGAGIVFAGLAVGFAIDSRLTADALEERCGSDLVCNEDLAFDPAEDNARQNRGLGLAIGFGVGAVGSLVAATVGLATSGADGGVALTPMIDNETAGCMLSGTF